MSCIQRTLRMRQLRSAIHTSGWRSYVAGLGGRRSASRVTGNSASSSSVRTGRDRILRAGFGTLVIGGTLGGAAYMYQQHPLHADHDEDSYGSVQQPPTPISTLLRSYIVYSLCSIPTLVDWSPTILGTLFSIPGVRQITEAIVRVTFFEQFVGGDTAAEALPLLEQLRRENKGALFAYSVEVDEAEASGKSGHDTIGTADAPVEGLPMHKRIVEEMIHCIDVAADFEDQRQSKVGERVLGRRTWVALKLSAMLPNAQALVNFSRHLTKNRPNAGSIPFPGCPHSSDLNILEKRTSTRQLDVIVSTPSDNDLFSAGDINELRELKEDLHRICRHAKKRGVRVIVDAEHSWYQPAIDAFVLDLMRSFNALPQHGSRLRSPLNVISNPRNYFTGGSAAGTSAHENDPVGVQPLVYATFQAYLRRTPAFLAQSLKDAEEGGYTLGVKLVRGAYHPHEIAAHHAASTERMPPASLDLPNDSKAEEVTSIKAVKRASRSKSPSISPEFLPPVWLSKAETDACYNEAAQLIISRIHEDLTKHKSASHAFRQGGRAPASPPPHVGVLFGTHNWTSCDVILDTLVQYGLASKEPSVSDDGKDGSPTMRETVRIPEDVAEYVTIGQLYGMSNSLTNSLVERTRCTVPFVIKYVPYGALAEVMPYLSRRAIENKSVLGEGGALEELRRTRAAIYHRIFG